jgi:hypothetical protein
MLVKRQIKSIIFLKNPRKYYRLDFSKVKIMNNFIDKKHLWERLPTKTRFYFIILFDGIKLNERRPLMHLHKGLDIANAFAEKNIKKLSSLKKATSPCYCAWQLTVD